MKTPQNSTRSLQRSKKTTKWWEEYDHISYKYKPISEEVILTLIKEATDDARTNPLVITPSKYFSNKGIARSSIYSWCNRSPEFAKGYEYLKELCSQNLLEGAAGINEKKLDAQVCLRRLPMIDPEWAEEREKVAKISKDATESKDVNLFVHEIPNSDLVPPKKANKNGSSN